MKNLQRLAIVTTIATYLLISVGAAVRASGSGLGCPEWPKCYGRWIPPTDPADVDSRFTGREINIPKAWIEYLNRLTGVVIGLLILATTVSAWRSGRGNRAIRNSVTAALALVVYQGWQGGQLVKHELDPRFVTVHLVLALVIVGLLIYATVLSRYGRIDFRSGPRQAERRRVARWTKLALLVAMVQIVLGALVRGEVDLAAREAPELDKAAWLDSVGTTLTMHGALAIVVTGAVLLAGFSASRIKGASTRGLTKLGIFNSSCVITQVAAGAVLSGFALPGWLQVIHVTVGSWLVGGLFCQYLLLCRPAGEDG